MLREALCIILSQSGHVVTAASSDPAELFEQVGREGADVAFIEVAGASDPEEGWRLISRLRAAFVDLRVIILTGAARDSGCLEQAVQVGVHGLLWKDTASVDVIVTTARRALDGQLVFQVAPAPLPAPWLEGPGELLRRWNLSARELDVLALLRTGLANQEIARHLGITERTVRAHISNIYRKTEAENRTELAITAQNLGMKPPPRAAALLVADRPVT